MIRLTMTDIIRLTVKDNGRGFDPAQVKPGSLGLKIMRERADKIGAHVTVTSVPGQWTTLGVEWKG
jgi:signal transduction histidine kinase